MRLLIDEIRQMLTPRESSDVGLGVPLVHIKHVAVEGCAAIKNMASGRKVIVSS